MKRIVSYFLGYQTGQNLSSYEEGPIFATDIDGKIFYQAVLDGLENRLDPDIQKNDLQATLTAFGKKVKTRTRSVGEINRAESDDFFTQNAKAEGVVTLPSGLQYKVLTPSEGRKFDEMRDGSDTEALISYEGRLLDGRIFDQSQEPTKIALNGIIAGLSEALKIMPVDAEWEIYVPSELAYGDHGPGIVPTQAAVIFKVKMHKLLPRKGAPGNPIELTPEMLKQLEEAGLEPM